MEEDGTINALRLLVQSCVDGEGEYDECARHTQNVELRELFAYRAQACREEAAELEAIMRDLGGRPEHRGSVLGVAHRGWMAIRSSLSANGDGVLLEGCERGEEIALKLYRGVLSGPLPESIRHLVVKHYDLARQTRDHIRMLRARMIAVAG
ncbi:MAG: PA2169 family four-helix-bundle protein [Proteobacteria bacterium]|nr:PA2169 family four-helix-bundle protein [Pseudomonadota bacterium]